MYSEDVDLCKKIALQGYKVAFLNSVALSHYGGGSTDRYEIKKFSTVMMAESKWLYFKKFNGKTYAALYKTLHGAMAVMKMVAGCLLYALLFPKKTKRNSALGSLKKNLYIFSWSVGKEKWIRR